MPRLYTIVLTGAAVIAVAASTVAYAASHAAELPPSVKARKAHMQLYAHNIGVLAGMARGNTDYDAEAASAAASNIAALSQLSQSTYWAPGTDSDSVEGSRALPAIWQNIPDVMSKAQALTEAAVSLSGTAGDGLEALQAGMGPLGGACGACHKAYQLPKD